MYDNQQMQDMNIPSTWFMVKVYGVIIPLTDAMVIGLAAAQDLPNSGICILGVMTPAATIMSAALVRLARITDPNMTTTIDEDGSVLMTERHTQPAVVAGKPASRLYQRRKLDGTVVGIFR